MIAHQITLIAARLANVPVEDVLSKKRHDHICYVRYIAMKMCVKYTELTYSNIGFFMNRTDSSVVHALNTHEDLYETDKKFRELSDKVDATVKKYIDRLIKNGKMNYYLPKIEVI